MDCEEVGLWPNIFHLKELNIELCGHFSRYYWVIANGLESECNGGWERKSINFKLNATSNCQLQYGADKTDWEELNGRTTQPAM